MILNTQKNCLPSIKEALYRCPGISRTQLAELLGIKAPSLVPYITELIEKGLIRETKEEGDGKKPGAGRKQIRLGIKGERGYAIGVELGPYATYLAIADLGGKTVYTKASEKINRDYDLSLAFISGIISDSISESGIRKERILGVSVTIPGYVEKKSGVVHIFPGSPDWDGRNIVSDLEKLVSLPFTIENNTRARAEGALLKTSIDITYFAYLFISRGMACPVMVNGNDISSRTAGAGELGYTIVDYSALEKGNEENDGRLINEASESAILGKCSAVMKAHPDSMLNTFAEDADNLEMKHVLAAFENNDRYVCEIMEKALMYTGYTMGNLINVINPQRIYIDAYIMKSQKSRDILTSYIHRSLRRLTEEEISLLFLDFTPYRGAEGACADALKTFFIEKE